MPFQKCKAALEAVEFTDCVSEEEMGSNFADVVTQLAQDVSFKHFSTYCLLFVQIFESYLIFPILTSFLMYFKSCLLFSVACSWGT